MGKYEYTFVSSLLSCEFTQAVLLRNTCSIRHCGVTPAGYHRVRSYSIYLALGNVSSLYRIYYGYNIIYVHVHCACIVHVYCIRLRHLSSVTHAGELPQYVV